MFRCAVPGVVVDRVMVEPEGIGLVWTCDQASTFEEASDGPALLAPVYHRPHLWIASVVPGAFAGDAVWTQPHPRHGRRFA
jgi:hypothetical protein